MEATLISDGSKVEWTVHKDPDMAGELARCMKMKGMTPAKCKRMMGGGKGM